MPDRLESSAITTYRYLRLSIVVVTFSLIVSVVLERLQTTCFEESVSAYYHTPARSIFVGGLVAIGVCLVAIKEEPGWRDALLNLSGALAPVVAFVPTSFSSRSCASYSTGEFDTRHGIGNNVVAYAAGAAVAVLLAVVIAHRKQQSTGSLERSDRFVLGAAVLMLVGGLVWYFGFPDHFLRHAHGPSAIGMFGIVGIVMVINALDGSRSRKLRRTYGGTALAMALIAVAVVVGKQVDEGWRHQILVLEILEIGAFLFYWAVQTFELWNDGVPAPSAAST